MKNQANAEDSSNFEDIFKSTKNVLEKLNTKQDSSSNTTTSKVPSKICDRKNLQSNNTTFPWLKFLGVKWGTKFLRKRKLQSNHTTFPWLKFLGVKWGAKFLRKRKLQSNHTTFS